MAETSCSASATGHPACRRRIRDHSGAPSGALHTVAPMAATAPPAIQPRRVVGPAHRHGLRTHSTPIRYPHSLPAAAPGRLLSVSLGC